ncbi:MAG: glycoside hydrolase [Rhizobiaceae bacterium]|nr:glycoside hydrolase [Rhizobiaceae bacterium]
MKPSRLALTISLAIATGITAACTKQEFNVDEVLRVKSVKHLKYGDHDPVRIHGRQPRTFPVHGIDISRYNTSINWRQAKKQGVDFVFIKATEGRDDVDRSFVEYWRAAKRIGIPRSAYHFYYFCALPEAQAENYIRNVPKSHSGLPPILDVEWNPDSPTCTKRPPASVVVNRLGRWLRKIEAHYGQKPIIYTTPDFFEANFARGALPGYQYWLRSVKAEPKYIYGKRPWVFWQYTGTGSIPGIKGPVDINAYRGSRSDWQKWLATNTR